MPPTSRSLGRALRNPRAGATEQGIGVVVHAPYLVNFGSPTPATYERSAAAVEAALRQVRDGLLPESTAGQARSLCATVEQHEAYLAALDFAPRLGLRLDTCHLFAAGEPIEEPGGTTATLDRLRLVHANDPMDDPQILLLKRLREEARVGVSR